MERGVNMEIKNKKIGTKTSAFGSPGRINHDSTKFYSSRLYEGLPKEYVSDYVENPIPPKFLDKILCKSSEQMKELPDSSIHLMVTSPPYNVGKEYDEDLTLDEYRAFLKSVWSEVKRVLVPGGRACINIANLGRKPYIPLHAFIIEDMLDLGFLMRGEIIWNKSSSSSPSTAWGSWQSAANPVLRDVHEYILVFSKGDYNRIANGKQNTITKEQFMEWTKSIWTMNAESARRIGHPAPFPEELPYRLIQLYSFKDDIVIDPFIGSGTTAVSAVKSERKFVGYEINQGYISLAKKRLMPYLTQTKIVL